MDHVFDISACFNEKLNTREVIGSINNMLPVDVLQHIILPQLSPYNLVSASMVCGLWRTVVGRSNRSPRTWKEQFQTVLSLFKDGHAIEFLEWFRSHLKYPLFDSEFDIPLLRECFKVAAKGLIRKTY
jgi:hypothetical protein